MNAPLAGERREREPKDYLCLKQEVVRIEGAACS